MQPVNDDMDHLFRQAANDYPLNTQGADFDKLQQRMQAESDKVPVKKEHKRRFAWLLLLLLPLPFICEHHYENGVPGSKQSVQQELSRKEEAYLQKMPAKKVATETVDSALAKLVSIDSNHAFTADSRTTSPIKSVQNITTTKQHSSIDQHSGNGSDNSNAGSGNSLSGNTIVATKKALVITKPAVFINDQKKHSSTNNRLIAKAADQQLQEEISIENSSKKTLSNNRDSITSEGATNITLKDSITKGKITDSTQIALQQTDSATAAIAKATVVKDSTPQDTTSPGKQLKKADKLKNFLYAGIVAGPDYSVVKSTRTGGTGYNTGLVAGYHFGKHWAVETGLLWNYKKYFSDGKYASVDNLSLLSHPQVLSIDGSCGMLEIPLAVQYHFNSNSKGHWYAAAGLSSYLMKKEEYYYLYKRYNMVYYSEKEYTNSTKNWLSALQLSGGYQMKLGRHSSLRVEPYLKLPVAKIGIAKLPLSSTGLNIGYIMSF